jgi:hypothetical protein
MKLHFSIVKIWFICCLPPLSITAVFGQNLTHNDLQAIAKTYAEAKVLSFDGNIKYYTNIANTSPEETSLVTYRKDGDKVAVSVGDQTVVYDGKLNIVVNHDQKVIYVSNQKAKSQKGILPTESLMAYLNSEHYRVQVSDYLGNKRKASILPNKQGAASSLEFIYQPNTHFIEFSRMIVNSDSEDVDPDLNGKKLEFSYYHYKTTLDEKIDTARFITKVKSGKKTVYKGVGQYKDFEVIEI